MFIYIYIYIYTYTYILLTLFIGRNVVESADYYGQNRRTSYTTQRPPKYIGVFPNIMYTTVYWTDMTDR